MKKNITVLIISVLIVTGLVIILIIKNSADPIQNIIEAPSGSVSITPGSNTSPEIRQTEEPENNVEASLELSSPEVSSEPSETEVTVGSPTPTATSDSVSTPTSDKPAPSEEIVIDAPIYELDAEEVLNWFTMDQEGVLQLFGPEYETIQTGIEEGFTSYYYRTLGLSIIFTPNGTSIYSIECDKNVRINEAHAGMTFTEIQELMGVTEVKCFNIPDYQDEKYYFIEYQIGNTKYSFSSFDETGTDSKLEIIKTI